MMECHTLESRPTAESLASAAKRFLDETGAHPERRFRQLEAIAGGAVLGALSCAPDRIVNHTAETGAIAASSLAAGWFLKRMVEQSSPTVRLTLTLAGQSALAIGAFEYYQNLSHDQEVRRDLTAIWNQDDRAARTALAQHLGPQSFNFALATICGSASFGRAEFRNWRAGPDLRSKAEVLQSEIFDQWQGLFRVDHMKCTRPAVSYFRYIENTSISERIQHLEGLLDRGNYQEAYNVTNGNLEWYNQRDRLFQTTHRQIRNELFEIGMRLQEHLVSPDGEALRTAYSCTGALKYGVFKEGNWPLPGIDPGQLDWPARLRLLPLKARIAEIDRLLEHRMLSDAHQLILANRDLCVRPRQQLQKQILEQSAEQLQQLNARDQLPAEQEPHYSKTIRSIQVRLAKIAAGLTHVNQPG